MYTVRENIKIKEPRKVVLPRLKPLFQVYRENEYGLPVSLFEDVTGLRADELYKKLVPMKYLTIVKVKKKAYILKDFYWLTLLEYLKSKGREVLSPSYTKLEYSKTV